MSIVEAQASKCVCWLGTGLQPVCEQTTYNIFALELQMPSQEKPKDRSM